MKRYLTIEGLETDAQGEPISDMGKAIGNIPDWNVLIDPGFIDPVTPSILNRARGNNFELVRRDSTTPPTIDSDEYGNLILNASENWIQGVSEAFINPDRWTFFFVAKGTDSGSIRNFVISDPESENIPGLRIAYSAGGDIIVYDQAIDTSGIPIRLLAPYDFTTREDFSLIVVSFSVEHGLKIMINGSIAAENPDDKQPLHPSVNDGDAYYFRLFYGQMGVCGQLNIDLGAPENSGYRRMLERYLMNKYGIS